jgi:hypothetical protein
MLTRVGLKLEYRIGVCRVTFCTVATTFCKVATTFCTVATTFCTVATTFGIVATTVCTVATTVFTVATKVCKVATTFYTVASKHFWVLSAELASRQSPSRRLEFEIGFLIPEKNLSTLI